MGPFGMSLRVMALVILTVADLVTAVEQEATDVIVTGSKWDERSSGDVDENRGCFTDGCAPDLVQDGLLNTVEESRWSCSDSLAPITDACYITFDLGASYTLTKISLYFRDSNDTGRDTNPFDISTSSDGTSYVFSFSGVNVAGTPLGTAEDFEFPAGSSGQYVRLTAVLTEDQWISINEALIYIDESTPSPASIGATAVPTSPQTNGGLDLTPSPSMEVYVDPALTVSPTAAPGDTLAPAFGSTSTPTAGPTPIGGADCDNVTVSGTVDLDGLFSSSVGTDGSTIYTSAGTNAATIVSSTATAECADSGVSDTDCTAIRWIIRPQDSSASLPTFLCYDDALHPSFITEVWLRVEDCTSTSSCVGTPADVSIVCGDGTGEVVVSPTPAPSILSDCGIVEVTGTSGGSVDGVFYDDESSLQDGVAQYNSYELVDGELSSTGNKLRASSVEGACSSECSFRQWWIEPDAADDTAFNYYTYDDADNPADIKSGSVWYTSNTTVLPYNGDISVTCAPATTPTLPPSLIGATLAPTPDSAGDEAPMPVTDDEASPPTDDSDAAGTTTGSGDDDSSSDIALIVGVSVGAIVLLALIAGAVAYKKSKGTPPPPPPSYDDLVGA